MINKCNQLRKTRPNALKAIMTLQKNSSRIASPALYLLLKNLK